MRTKIIIGGLAILFFILYAWFGFATLEAGSLTGFATPEIFNSPDETANYFFIERFAKHGDFFVPESLNYFLENRVHPRSISYNGISLVSQGFIGLPLLYGWIAKICGLGIVKFITPFLAVLGALAFYGIIKKIFDKKIAVLSLILLFLFPIFWYYSSRALYPNIPFVSLLLAAGWAGVNGAFLGGAKKHYLFIFAIAFGGALIIRPIEILWTAPALLILLFIYRKEVSFIRIIYSILILSFLALPALSNNYFLYGGIFKTGYTLTEAVKHGAQTGIIKETKIDIFPFGFHPRIIWQNVYYFLIRYFWWYSAPAFFGFLIWLFGRKTKKQKAYLLTAALSSAWLALFYGSGIFADNPNFGRFVIGDSHFRYWLPIFIFMIPFIAIFWQIISKKFKILLPALIIFIAALSVNSVYFSLDDGLLAVKDNLEKNHKTKLEVLKITDPKDIIITARQDKIFFPERQVLYAEKINDDKLLSGVSALNTREFYYYTIGFNTEEFVKINHALRFYGLRLKRIEIFGKEVLYKLIKINEAFI